ncbi:MATE family efflux transporter [Spirochaeta isovalerica]|uniref:Multidrug-efflux transporter n=1 Tax=Spirochaeta isovalerica TaxID=150 RepID=A0A841RBC2_9SPIO|nr:MATE family efflux transporter [Spirochaeta isovalerica]MBB6481233.1 putative MATE family efflux protein [Spirochaeta isovalerica]
MNKKMYDEIIRFTLPCLAELFLFSLISVVNMAMVGRLGAAALSAVGLSSQPVRISIALFQAFNIGATAMIARYTGARDYGNARKVIVQTIQFAFVAGLIISLPFYIFAEQIVMFMGARSDSLKEGITYMRFMAAGTVFQVLPLAVSSLLRGAGDSRNAMLINILANIINVVLGYVLIFGFAFIPAFGVWGAGMAATVSKASASMLGLVLLFKTKLPVRLKGKVVLGWDKTVLKGIAGIGSSSAAEQLVLRSGFFLYTRMIANLGTVAFAAHQVALTVSNLSTNLGQALGIASSSFTGRHLGAQRPDRAVLYVQVLHHGAFLISLIVSILFLLSGDGLVRIFTADIKVIDVFGPILFILAVINPAQNTFLVYSGSIKGAGDTRWPLLVSLVGLIFVRIPLVYISIHYLKWGLTGAWIATAVEKYLGYIMLRIRFAGGKWKKVKIV